jgi:hypothetical protein
MKAKALLLAAALAPLPFAANAALPCGVPVKDKLDVRDYERLASLTADQARTRALAAAGSGAEVKKGRLETERGCLVYKYDVKVSGKSGVQEILVDAGSGEILKSKHESALRDKVEGAVDPKRNLGTAKNEQLDKQMATPAPR